MILSYMTKLQVIYSAVKRLQQRYIIEKLTLFLMLALLSSSVNADAQVLRHVEALSRDHYYVHIDDTETPYIARDIVGGEHINLYHILGFQEESFVIVLQSPDDSMSYSIHGDGIQRIQRPKGNLVTVESENTWITIEVSAYPETAEYNLIVKKHEF